MCHAGRMLAVIDGSLVAYFRTNPHPSSLAPSVLTAFDREVVSRSFSLGTQLQPYTRAELSASVAALCSRAFEGGYGSGVSMAQKVLRQEEEDLRAQVAAALDQVRELHVNKWREGGLAWPPCMSGSGCPTSRLSCAQICMNNCQ